MAVCVIKLEIQRSEETLFELIRQYHGDSSPMYRVFRDTRTKLQRSWWVARSEVYKTLKRQIDTLVSALLFSAVSPILIVVSTVIKLSDGGHSFTVTCGSAKTGTLSWF